MQWVKEFYTRQQEWLQLYTMDMQEHQRQLARTVHEALGLDSQPVLELGAGGGQFAVALAQLNYSVTAVELVAANAEHGRRLAADAQPGTLTVLEADFFTVTLPQGHFAAICYWDGFGLGSDTEQRQLLLRMANWLHPDGVVFMDVYTPWYWAAQADAELSIGSIKRRYRFDAEHCRMLDTWWPADQPHLAVTQSLRCYAPADLERLLHGTELSITQIVPGGAVDADGNYQEQVPLQQAMSYRVQLRRTLIGGG